MKVSTLVALVAAFIGVLGFNTAARAVIFFDYSSNNGGLVNSGALSVGSQFTVGSYPVHLTEVGQYGLGQSTLPASSHVELWTTTGASTMGTYVADWTIPIHTAVSSDFFAWMPVTPLLLAANTTYVLSSFGEAALNNSPLDGSFTGTDITYAGRRYDLGGTDVFPGTFGGIDSYVDMGPSFEFSIPEPASMAMLALGGVALLKRRRA